MVKRLAHFMFGRLSYAWMVSRVGRDGEVVSPTDEPISHGSGPDPDRVLLLGGLLAGGYGVASYDLAVAGHLARQLAARTGRGADIETRAVRGFDTFTAAELLRSENLERFDAVVMVLGVAEAASGRPLSAYRRDIDRLLAVIAELRPAATPVLIPGVADFTDGFDVPRWLGRWLHRRIDRQNAETRSACERSGAAEYVPFTPERADIRYAHEAAAIYETWAAELLPALERALAVGELARAGPPRSADERQRQHALDALGIDPAPDPAIERIVEMAREMLGADGASLNIIDRGTQWSMATSGDITTDLPREQAICDVTIRSPGAHIIEDVDAVPALRGIPWLSAEGHPRFYAGYPLEAPGGQRVGALCVVQRTPRRFDTAETAVLRDLALRAQALLWRSAG